MSVQIAPQRNATGISMRDSIPSGYKKGSLQQFTPEQMSIFQNMYSNLGPDSFYHAFQEEMKELLIKWKNLPYVNLQVCKVI